MTNITDAGVANLAALTQLEFLDLLGTDVSDASIIVLARLGKLKRIDLSYTRRSEQAPS